MSERKVFSVKYNSLDRYYIVYNSEFTFMQIKHINEIETDVEISSLLKLSKKEYQRTMLEKYNCYIHEKTKELYFPTREDAEKSVDWLNAMYLMAKISN